MSILKDLTLIDANTDGGLILTLDDPRLFHYPIAYMWEPGFWTMTDLEAERFREYLLKGGFAIFDDFEEEQWNNFEAQMSRVLPEARFVKLDKTHRIFDSFFRMNTIDFPHPMYGILPTYYGIFEDNDPAKRLMVIANHNHDVAEYWEFSGTGFFSGRSVERSLQARRQLHAVRTHSLDNLCNLEFGIRTNVQPFRTLEQCTHSQFQIPIPDSVSPPSDPSTCPPRPRSSRRGALPAAGSSVSVFASTST